MKDPKERILEFLKTKEKSTTEISSFLSRNYYDAIEILEELEKEGKIERLNAGNYTFWRLKNEDN